MNKQKLISVLQSRIAQRRKKISHEWFIYSYEGCEYDYDMWDRIGAKEYGNRLGLEQKQDKQIMKALIEAERYRSRTLILAVKYNLLVDRIATWNNTREK